MTRACSLHPGFIAARRVPILLRSTEHWGDSMVNRTHYGDDKAELLTRLRRIEGQVRGLQQMIIDDRYCLEVVQQINALTAAAREVGLLVVEDHLRGIVAEAVNTRDGEAAITEMTTVLRRMLRP